MTEPKRVESEQTTTVVSEPMRRTARGLVGLLAEKADPRREDETFDEWCERMGFDPRCTCDFGRFLPTKDR